MQPEFVAYPVTTNLINDLSDCMYSEIRLVQCHVYTKVMLMSDDDDDNGEILIL